MSDTEEAKRHVAEAEEAAAWVAEEMRRLREVLVAVKKHLTAWPSDERLNGLREAVVAADLAGWYARRPSSAAAMLPWLRAWPSASERVVRAWVEGNLGVVTDGHALLAVRDAKIEDHERPSDMRGGGPAAYIIQTVNWKTAYIVRQSDLRRVMREAMLGQEDDFEDVVVGPARLDPGLMDRFLPPLADDAWLEVYHGDQGDNWDPVGFRPYGANSGAWTVVIMPRRSEEDALHIVPLEAPPF